MDAPNPDHVAQASLLSKYGGIIAAFISGIFATALTIFKSLGGRFKSIEERLDKKADKDDVRLAIDHFNEEHRMTRSTMGKMFDQIRENENRSQERYENLINEIRSRGRK